MGKGTIESPELGKIFSEKTSSISAVRGVDIEKDNKSESDYYCRLHSSSTSSGDCDESHIPMFGNYIRYELPEYPEKLRHLILEFKDRFSSTPGLTDITCHRICTGESKPIRYLIGEFQHSIWSLESS